MTYRICPTCGTPATVIEADTPAAPTTPMREALDELAEASPVDEISDAPWIVERGSITWMIREGEGGPQVGNFILEADARWVAGQRNAIEAEVASPAALACTRDEPHAECVATNHYAGGPWKCHAPTERAASPAALPHEKDHWPHMDGSGRWCRACDPAAPLDTAMRHNVETFLEQQDANEGVRQLLDIIDRITEGGEVRLYEDEHRAVARLRSPESDR